MTKTLCLSCRLLLVSDGALARTFAGARVGMRALAANRQAAAMTESTIGSDFNQPLDVHRDIFAEIAFHPAFVLDDLTDAVDFVFREILHLLVRIDTRRLENLVGARIADSVNVRESDHRMLVTRKINTCNT